MGRTYYLPSPYADNAPAHEASHRRGRLDLRKTAPGQGSFPHEQCHPGFVDGRAKGKSEVVGEVAWQTRGARSYGPPHDLARPGGRQRDLPQPMVPFLPELIPTLERHGYL